MQGIFVEYGITVDDDARVFETADLEARQINNQYITKTGEPGN